MKVDLDWLHSLVAQTRWRCTKKTPPREWELEVEFRMIPQEGPSTAESIAVGFRENRTIPDRDRRRAMRAEFQKCRQGLHTVIMRMGTSGLRRGIPFAGIIPLGLQANPDHDDFDRVYELIDPTEERPESWVLRDRATDLMVEFKIPDGISRGERRERLKDAMLRMYDLKKRVRGTTAHAKVARAPAGIEIVQ